MSITRAAAFCNLWTALSLVKKGKNDQVFTFESQEKFPFFIETAGSSGSSGELGIKILSSAKSSSSRRCNDTFAFTTW